MRPFSEEEKLPSELIEKYIKHFLMLTIESVGCGMLDPKEARKELKSVNYFIDTCCGLHARIATSNEFSKFSNLNDDEMVMICKKCIL